ncbi:isoamyl alcohol [Fusarium beomiforme]|uniref:Isoamyl alcohol n=1 Tax=Fusarium beomiforme TaxID=44412 RepID=A0A9P5DSN7_9HYPO|nr:isoamyl alcohol [Fusarium beomiforme]
MRTSFSSILFSLWLLCLGVLAHDESCGCTVKYIVVEMPPQTVAAQTATPTITSVQTKPTYIRSKPNQTTVKASSTSAHHNTTATFLPKVPAKVDLSNPENAVPKKNISMSYGDVEKPHNQTFPALNTTAPKGAIDMDLVMNHPAVVLDHIDAIVSVECSADSVKVQFGKSAAFNKAIDTWSDDEPFILITSNMGNCKTEIGQAFYVVDGVTTDKNEKSITCHAAEKELADIAETCEMSFNSIPATKLTKRLSLNPSLSLNFGTGLERDTVLFQEQPWVTIKAEKAEFSSTVSFSGRAKYNFWKFKMEHLYFDLDTHFSADVALAADVAAAWSRSILYDPDTLTYTLVEVPGILSLGPGLSFAVGVDVDTSAAVAVRAGAGIAIPAANVHLDFLDSGKNAATGWEPQYTSYANITESVEVGLNASASLTVQLTFKLLGGLVDLSSGLTATPEFVNKFTLDAAQSAHASNDGAGVNLLDAEKVAPATTPGSELAVVNEPKDCGVSFKSDFIFDLEGFATKWWKANLYHVEVPISDIMAMQDTVDEVRHKVSAWLNTTPYAASSLEPLAGGQANFIYRAQLLRPLEDGTTEVVVKHGEPYMARHPANAVTLNRCHVEAEILSELAANEPQIDWSGNASFTVKATKLYLYDAQTKTLILEYLPNVADLKACSLNHFSSPSPGSLREPTKDLGRTLAKYITKFHNATRKAVQDSLNTKQAQRSLGSNTVMHGSDEMQKLKHYINFDWMIERVDQFPDILVEAKETLHLVKNMALVELSGPSADLTLIHGDYHPQNILLEKSYLETGATKTLYVVDWENAQVGVPSLDHGGMLGEMYALWKYKRIDAGLWIFQGYAEGLAPLTEEVAWRTALQVGVHLLSFGTLAPGCGTGEEVEEMARLARDIIVKAWNRDRVWFDHSEFSCLFAGVTEG